MFREFGINAKPLIPISDQRFCLADFSNGYLAAPSLALASLALPSSATFSVDVL